jgi:hypothetical protein
MKQVLSTLGLFFFLSLPTAAQEYQQDVNFFELQVAQPVHTGDKIEVQTGVRGVCSTPCNTESLMGV